jgi:hypothetical protein
LIVPAIELAKPPITVEPSTSLLSVISARACCRSRDGSSVTLEETSPCFGVEYESSIQLDPGIFTSAPRLLANQYLFRFTTGADQRSSYVDGSLINVVLPVFREQAEQYCFEVAAIELPTLDEYPYEEIMGCAAHGALADLGVSTAEPGPSELIRDVCQAPPIGLEAAWCEVNAACEDDDEGTLLCGLYAHVCDGEPLGPLPPADAGTSEAGAGEGPAEPDASDEAPAGSGGCSVTSAPGSSPPGLGLGWTAAALATAILMGRGHRSRARVCHGTS